MPFDFNDIDIGNSKQFKVIMMLQKSMTIKVIMMSQKSMTIKVIMTSQGQYKHDSF